MKKQALIVLLLFGLVVAASARSPFLVPDDPNWKRAGSPEDIRASGLVYACTDPDETELHIVFFHRVTPHETRQEHLDFFKEFLRNIQQVYPNVLMVSTEVLGEEVPFVSVFDTEGNTFFWGAIHQRGKTFEIAVTAEGRRPDLPHQVKDLLRKVECKD